MEYEIRSVITRIYGFFFFLAFESSGFYNNNNNNNIGVGTFLCTYRFGINIMEIFDPGLSDGWLPHVKYIRMINNNIFIIDPQVR